MITKNEFSKIDLEVKESVQEAFEFLKKNCVDHNYILFLADGEYHPKLRDSHLRLNPYTIDNREDYYKDKSRQDFFINFMRTFYSFPKGKNETEDNEIRMTMELMVYTHIWESKPFLKQLFKIASLVEDKSYKWSVEVPEMSKHEFLREEIRDKLKAKGLKLADIISKGFHTSLRNAFAHSEYYFSQFMKVIQLDTYKGASWDIENISFNDWTKRFAYTAFLSHHFFNERFERRKELVKVFGKTEFLIVHPVTENRFKVRRIFYDSESDRFSFYKRGDGE